MHTPNYIHVCSRSAHDNSLVNLFSCVTPITPVSNTSYSNARRNTNRSIESVQNITVVVRILLVSNELILTCFESNRHNLKV